MPTFYELASTRRSIRKYTDAPVAQGVIEDCIRTAVHAPSGCDSQCWKFVIVRDREYIQKMETAAVRKVEILLQAKQSQLAPEYLTSKRKVVGFFSKAPVVIAVFMSSFKFYDPTFISVLKESGLTYDDIMELFARPDLLSIGAVIQTLLLAIHEKGYGACWMNEPAMAGEEIRKILGVAEGHRLMSLIPVGVPAYQPREKALKAFDEICTVLG